MDLKPLKKSGVPTLLQEIYGQTLTRVADDVLLGKAEIVSEGEIVQNDNSQSAFCGSTMVTIDLKDFVTIKRDAKQWEEALLRAVSRSISFRIRLMRIARAQTQQRTCPLLPKEITTELEFTIEEGRLLVDIDIECPLAQPFLEVNETGGEIK